MDTKNNEVLNWLKSGKPLTSLMAVQMFGITNLPSVIFRLRNKGYVIKTEDVKDTYGRKCFTQYKMEVNDE
jgi:hypothetical protein